MPVVCGFLKVREKLHMIVAWFLCVATANIGQEQREEDQCGFWEPVIKGLQRSGSEK